MELAPRTRLMAGQLAIDAGQPAARTLNAQGRWVHPDGWRCGAVGLQLGRVWRVHEARQPIFPKLRGLAPSSIATPDSELAPANCLRSTVQHNLSGAQLRLLVDLASPPAQGPPIAILRPRQ